MSLNNTVRAVYSIVSILSAPTPLLLTNIVAVNINTDIICLLAQHMLNIHPDHLINWSKLSTSAYIQFFHIIIFS